MRYACLVCVYIFFACQSAFGQTRFKGVLINKVDSSVIPYAAVKLGEGNSDYVLTNAAGEFELSVPDGKRQLTFDITALGCHSTVPLQRTFASVEKIYVEVTPTALADFSIVGLSAEDVVRKAVASIPKNYMDSSYFSFSSYRQYELVNGIYKNLVEALPVVMFRLSRTKKELTSKEAFAVQQFRRSKFFRYPSQDASDNGGLDDLLMEDPIYHLAESSLQPGRISAYRFSFDTTVKSADAYVIRYEYSKSTTERHGISNYRELAPAFLGESQESGTLTIDRVTFAIKKIERLAKRYPSFSYWGKPNLIYPDKKYFDEFIDARLMAEYEPLNGKWYLKTLYHKYTNEYFRAMEGTKDYVITDFFEWRSDSVSRYIGQDLVNSFFRKMPGHVYNYDKIFWANTNFPFFFCSKDSVYRDIELSGTIETQFYEQSLKKEQ